MGLFDKLSGGDNGLGFANVKNTRNFKNEDLFEKLSGIKVSCGTPIMGAIKDKQAILYKNVSDSYDIFVRVEGEKVNVGKIASDNSSTGSNLLGAGLDMFLGRKDKDTSKVDRAVSEIADVLKKLEEGETVTVSKSAAPANTSTGEAISFYMKQKAISLKPKFDITDKNGGAVYHVEGDLARLNFSIQKNGTEVLKLKKKLLAFMPEYSIEKSGSPVAKIKKKLKFTKPELVGDVNGKELKILGDLLGFDFDITVGGNTIGHVDVDSQIWSDCYRISIRDESMQDVMIALAIICDNVVDQSNS